MSHSIVVTSFQIDLIKDSGYCTWVDFWLNHFRTEGMTYVYYDTDGNIGKVDLPFGIRVLEILIVEEFKMILEHLGFSSFEDFEAQIQKKMGSAGYEMQPIELFVRTKDNHVLYRTYQFTENAIAKLKSVFKKPLPHLMWNEYLKKELAVVPFFLNLFIIEDGINLLLWLSLYPFVHPCIPVGN